MRMRSQSVYLRILHKTALIVAIVTSVAGVSSAQSRPTGPCDIYASATPCVAAFSTTRALFSSYSGFLYKVTRSSDNGTTNIGVNSNGYANAAAQDSFCTDTVCTITELYDQTSNHNNLNLAPPGANGTGSGPSGYDIGVNAGSLPITAGGQKVYGMYFIPGMGYRNDSTTGIAVNGQAEGVYMVTSGIHFNGGCCFDFGNAETSNNDTGNGHMDAINIICGSSCSNPAVGIDMENGIYGMTAVGNDTTPFVTAMGSNDGQSTYAVYEGNAQSGSLAGTGTISLPCCGYAPMSQEGAIILGIGGDNSLTSAGSFFEGVMTKGAPTSSVESSIQSNIVGAGYRGGTGCYTLHNESTGNELWQTGNVYNSVAGVYYLVDVPGGWTGDYAIWQLTLQPNGYYVVTSEGQDGQLWVTGDSYGGPSTGYLYVVTVPTAWTGDYRYWSLESSGDGNNYLVSKSNPTLELQETGNTYNGASNVFYTAATPAAWNATYQRFSLTSVACP